MAALTSFSTAQGTFAVRRAVEEDLPAILALLRDDPIGGQREFEMGNWAAVAFSAIDVDPNQLLLVVVDEWDDVVATMQVTFIADLSRNGTLRAQLEAVRVSRERRDLGLGSVFLRWVIDECRRRGAGLIQLTTDKRRDGARRFYESQGFEATHEGMKLEVSDNASIAVLDDGGPQDTSEQRIETVLSADVVEL